MGPRPFEDFKTVKDDLKRQQKTLLNLLNQKMVGGLCKEVALSKCIR